jgi:hypothetical protein
MNIVMFYLQQPQYLYYCCTREEYPRQLMMLRGWQRLLPTSGITQKKDKAEGCLTVDRTFKIT